MTSAFTLPVHALDTSKSQHTCIILSKFTRKSRYAVINIQLKVVLHRVSLNTSNTYSQVSSTPCRHSLRFRSLHLICIDLDIHNLIHWENSQIVNIFLICQKLEKVHFHYSVYWVCHKWCSKFKSFITICSSQICTSFRVYIINWGPLYILTFKCWTLLNASWRFLVIFTIIWYKLFSYGNSEISLPKLTTVSCFLNGETVGL